MQVREKQGGGTRKAVMDINAGYYDILKEDVLSELKVLFFADRMGLITLLSYK